MQLTTMMSNTTTANGSEMAESPADFVEYKIANWLWFHIAPSLFIIGLAGNNYRCNV